MSTEESKEESKEVPKSNESHKLDENYSYDESNNLVYTDPVSKTAFVWKGDEWQAMSNANEAKESSKGVWLENGVYKCINDQGQKLVWSEEHKEWKPDQEMPDNNKRNTKNDPHKEEGEEEDEESDLDDEQSLSAEQLKEKRYRKRKAMPNWNDHQKQYSVDPLSGKTLYTDSRDGSVYEWDEEKKAWFPRIDDDFMAQYQLNYGFTPDGKAEPTRPDESGGPSDSATPASKKSKAEQDVSKNNTSNKWFDEDPEKSTKVYVSNLPLTMDEDQFTSFMSKCGLIDVDIRTKKPKIKLYYDTNKEFKGDGLCTYVKVESVSLALQILDGFEIEGKRVKVERAKFNMKGDAYDPKLRPQKLKKKEKELLKKKREKMFEWEMDQNTARAKRERVVIIRNLFNPQDFDANASLILDYTQRLREQCSEFGEVRKVVVHDKHVEGVAQVTFGTAEEADIALNMLDGRLFSNRRVMSVTRWDGKEKFKVEETEEEQRARREQWEKYLMNEDDRN